MKTKGIVHHLSRNWKTAECGDQCWYWW